MLILKNETLEKLCAHARREYPKECCGFLLGMRQNGRKEAHCVIEAENIVQNGKDTAYFQIDPLEVMKAESAAQRMRLEIVGFYHSHPNCEAIASKEDALHMIAGYSYPIISVNSGECTNVRSFEKTLQTDAAAQEEVLLKES